MTGCACQNGRHSEQHTKFPIEDCKQDRSAATATPLSPEKGAYGASEAFREKRGGSVRHNERSLAHAEKSIPKDFELWRAACPELADFEPVRSIEQAAATGAELLRACGLAQRAFDRAALSIGAVNAGLVALFVYQRHADGERPGGHADTITGRLIRLVDSRNRTGSSRSCARPHDAAPEAPHGATTLSRVSRIGRRRLRLKHVASLCTRRAHAAEFSEEVAPPNVSTRRRSRATSRAVNLAPAPIARQFCFASAPRKPDRRPCRFTFPRARTPDEIVTKVRRRIRCGALPREA